MGLQDRERPGYGTRSRLDTPRVGLIALGVLLLASVTVRTYLASKIVTPQLLCDEFIYAGIAKSLALSGQFAVRGEPSTVSYVYPALLAPAWWAHSMETVYFLAKVINALVMSLAAIPFFFWVRRLSTPAWALVATAILLVLPAFDYTGMLMTENAFLPMFLVTAFAIASSLERPTTITQLLTVVAIAVSLGVRAQAAAFVLVLPGAILLYALLDRSVVAEPWQRMIRGVRAHRIALLTLVGLGVFYAAVRLAGSPSDTLATYRVVFHANYSLLEGLRSSGYHLAELTLVTGVVPLSAFLILVGLVVGRSFPATRAENAFVAVAVTAFVAFILEIGFFTSKFAGSVAERYSFYLGPLLLIGLVVWLHRGLPRPVGLTVASALAAALLVIWLPLARFSTVSTLYSAFGLYAFYRLPTRLHTTPGHVELIVSVMSVLALVAFALVPRRLVRAAVPVLLGLFFAVSSWPAYGALRGNALLVRSSMGAGHDSSWVEDGLGRATPATYLYVASQGGPFDATRLALQTEFWNRNIKWVTTTGGTEVCSLPERKAQIEPASGTFRPAVPGERLVAGSSVITNPQVSLAGRKLASQPLLVAYRVRPPLRLASSTTGVYSDGWTGPHASYTSFEAPPPGSSLLVGVSRTNWTGTDVPGAVKVRVSTLAAKDPRQTGRTVATRRWVIHSGIGRNFHFRAPRGPFRVDLHIDPPLVPADFGVPDSRSLGAMFAVRVTREKRS